MMPFLIFDIRSFWLVTGKYSFPNVKDVMPLNLAPLSFILLLFMFGLVCLLWPEVIRKRSEHVT